MRSRAQPYWINDKCKEFIELIFSLCYFKQILLVLFAYQCQIEEMLMYNSHSTGTINYLGIVQYNPIPPTTSPHIHP